MNQASHPQKSIKRNYYISEQISCIFYVHISCVNKVTSRNYNTKGRKKLRDALNNLPIVLKVKRQAELQNIQESFALKTEVQNCEYREVQ